jgi:hypothetical protein
VGCLPSQRRVFCSHEPRANRTPTAHPRTECREGVSWVDGASCQSDSSRTAPPPHRSHIPPQPTPSLRSVVPRAMSSRDLTVVRHRRTKGPTSLASLPSIAQQDPATARAGAKVRIASRLGVSWCPAERSKAGLGGRARVSGRASAARAFGTTIDEDEPNVRTQTYPPHETRTRNGDRRKYHSRPPVRTLPRIRTPIHLADGFKTLTNGAV